MQTFVPSSNIFECPLLLDYKRLGKQRVETIQILNALLGKSRGWTNHPATRMWKGFESSLAFYGLLMCSRWMSLGYKDTCALKLKELIPNDFDLVLPEWWGGPIHASHRSQLLRKDLEFYSQFGWQEEPGKIEYIWPK